MFTVNLNYRSLFNKTKLLRTTVKPPNKGPIEDDINSHALSLVYREVVLFLEVQIAIGNKIFRSGFTVYYNFCACDHNSDTLVLSFRNSNFCRHHKRCTAYIENCVKSICILYIYLSLNSESNFRLP